MIKDLSFYTNFNSKKGSDLKINKKSSMCFHWKSIRRQVRIVGEVEKVTDKEQMIIITQDHIKIKLVHGLPLNLKF